MRTVFYRVAIVGMCIMMAVGCASIIHGTTQDIQVSSSPDEAEVWVDGFQMGKTPTKVTLKRGDVHTIKIVRKGYKDVSLEVDHQVSPWIIGNVVFGGIIGCGIDFITGGAYDLTPERFDVNLTQATSLNGQTIHLGQVGSEIKYIDFVDNDGVPVYEVSVAWQN